MIIGSTTHDGNAALAQHLLDTEDNEEVLVRTFGLLSDTAFPALDELVRLAHGTRSRRPLLHVWASPAIEYDEDNWDHLWRLYEIEFGLEGQPFLEVTHRKRGKGGRTVPHTHRAYLRVTPDGRAIPVNNSAARQEKIARIAEFDLGEPFTRGVYTRSVCDHLRRENRKDVAEAMEDRGLDLCPTLSMCNPEERAVTARTGDMPADFVRERIFMSLLTHGDGHALADDLAAQGLQLSRGEKAIGVLTPRGKFYPLVRTFNRIAKIRGAMPLKKADVDGLFERIDLPIATGDASEPVVTEAPRRQIGEQRRRRKLDSKADANLDDRRAMVEIVRPRADTVAASPVANVAQLTPEQRAALSVWRRAMFDDHVNDVPAVHEAFDFPAASPAHIQRGDTAPGAAARYKARLAGLPVSLGDKIGWVERAPSRARLTLRSGAVITVTDSVIRTTHDRLDTVEIIVAQAVSQKWTTATIGVGSERWREAMARALVRAGIELVDNPELSTVVADEQRSMTIDQALAAWHQARQALTTSRTKGIADAELYLLALELAQTAHDLRTLEPFLRMSPSEIERLEKDCKAVTTLAARSRKARAAAESSTVRPRAGPSP